MTSHTQAEVEEGTDWQTVHRLRGGEAGKGQQPQELMMGLGDDLITFYTFLELQIYFGPI